MSETSGQNVVPPSHAVADLWWTADAKSVVLVAGAASPARTAMVDGAAGQTVLRWLDVRRGTPLAALVESVATGGAGGHVDAVLGGMRCHVRVQPAADGSGWGGALFELGGASDEPRSADDARQHQRLEVIGTLASGVAHEINNPIQSIMNYAQLIRNRAKDEQLGEYAREILFEAQRVGGIVKNLLFFARQEGQPYAEAHMGALVEQTLSLTAAVLRREQVHVEVDVPDDLPAVACHPQQIQQVILNLVTNARDALNARYPDGGDDKRLRITAALGEGGATVRTTIEDRGGGMDEVEAERLFDPERLKLDHGSGLGLSVCHAIVEDHGGRLAVETDGGSFTRIFLDLPVGGN